MALEITALPLKLWRNREFLSQLLLLPTAALVVPVSVKIPFGDREILVETGHLGRQASGSVMATDGETIVYTSVCLSDVPSEPSDFFPLSVNYQERFSAAGRTSDGFFKREGRTKDNEVLICRLIDRPLRPTMLKGFYHETQLLSWKTLAKVANCYGRLRELIVGHSFVCLEPYLNVIYQLPPNDLHKSHWNCEIKSIAPYGVFVEIAPGRVAFKVGDLVDVKLIEVNDKGQLRLSCHALLPVPQTNPEEPSSKQLTGEPAEVIADSGEVSDKSTPKKYVNVPKADGSAEKKIEHAKDKSSATKLPSSSKSNSAENTLLPQKKVFKRIKSSSKAVTGVSGKDVE
ncbi:hypothetical protein CRYUN_Cryun16bG0038700 [Craigia yunnanensis]